MQVETLMDSEVQFLFHHISFWIVLRRTQLWTSGPTELYEGRAPALCRFEEDMVQQAQLRASLPEPQQEEGCTEADTCQLPKAEREYQVSFCYMKVSFASSVGGVGLQNPVKRLQKLGFEKMWGGGWGVA